MALLIGDAISGERTLEDFYDHLRPFALPFMSLFGRDRLPDRSTLSRFLAALTPEPVEALRTLILSDLLARPLAKEEQASGLWDRAGTQWVVFDVDGTREAARQRALPKGPDRAVAHRRLRPLCAPGLATRGASGEKSCAPAPRCCKRTPISGSQRSATLAMANTGQNCAGRSQPFNATARPMTFQWNGCSCGWMGNMALERSSLTWLASRM